MKDIKYIALSELAEHQKAHPGVYPVFKDIKRVDGQLMGVLKAYSDEFGNRYPVEESHSPVN